ncbi:MAG: glycosyltransferase [Burkholderiales bacterium]
MRLVDVKDPLGLLSALAGSDRPDLTLAIAGDGPLRPALEARAAEPDLRGRVHLLGVRDDLEDVYPAFDAFVLSSRSEGLPMALLEAMACGLPAIATAVGRVPEVLAGLPAGAGTLVPPGDAAALAAALAAFEVPDGVADAVRTRVLERFSSAALARAYADVYRDLIGPAAAGLVAASPRA